MENHNNNIFKIVGSKYLEFLRLSRLDPVLMDARDLRVIFDAKREI